MANVATKFGLGSGGGPYFGQNDAHLIIPISDAAATFVVYENVTGRASDTVACFTAFAAYMGTTDTTNWTADTYKTIYSHTGKGRFAGFLGPTMAGTDITTLEITIDGVVKEIPFTGASGARVWFGMYMPQTTAQFTTAATFEQQGGEAINAAKTGFTDQFGNTALLPWRSITLMGIPVLRYNTSLLVRAKHSQNITNSTATAYSAVQHIAGI